MTCDCNAGVACDKCGFDLSDEWSLMARDAEQAKTELASEQARHKAWLYGAFREMRARAERAEAALADLKELFRLTGERRESETQAALRDVAARQREATTLACVDAVRHSQQTTDQCRVEVREAGRATPLVTDGES